MALRSWINIVDYTGQYCLLLRVGSRAGLCVCRGRRLWLSYVLGVPGRKSTCVRTGRQVRLVGPVALDTRRLCGFYLCCCCCVVLDPIAGTVNKYAGYVMFCLSCGGHGRGERGERCLSCTSAPVASNWSQLAGLDALPGVENLRACAYILSLACCAQTLALASSFSPPPPFPSNPYCQTPERAQNTIIPLGSQSSSSRRSLADVALGPSGLLDSCRSLCRPNECVGECLVSTVEAQHLHHPFVLSVYAIGANLPRLGFDLFFSLFFFLFFSLFFVPFFLPFFRPFFLFFLLRST